MFERLKSIIGNSYSIYSNFATACIVEMKDGTTFEGVNVENPSFKDGLCAEQVAIGTAIAYGYTKGDFEKIYLMGSKKHFITPCFLCRQLIVELIEDEKNIISYNIDGNYMEYNIGKLCPNSFTERDLEND